MSRITIYSWGYWGWGNAAPELVKAVDTVERMRGFKPPVFVDIRMKRSARPADFRGDAFGAVVGESRYETMNALGNEVFLDPAKRRLPDSTRQIVIHDPGAAELLLDRAIRLKRQNRHVIFFCACEFPRGNLSNDGEIYSCHRSTVTKLLMKIAKRRDVPLEIVEWPGGSNKKLNVAVSPEDLLNVRSGRKFLQIPNPRPLAKWASIPWGTIARLHSQQDSVLIVTGPAKFKQGEWCLQVLDWNEPRNLMKSEKSAARWRSIHGMEPSCA
jgi:hypothetical protein